MSAQEAANPASKMMLYWASGSPPCWKIQIVLEEKDLAGYGGTFMEFSKRDHKKPEMLALNPRGQIPVFTDGDVVISDSNATCLYLEDVYKSRGSQLMPGDPATKAVVLQRTEETKDMFTLLSGIVHYFFGPKEKHNDEATLQKKADLKNELSIWENYLSSIRLAGTEFTLADASAFPMLAMVARLGFKFESQGFPRLQRYYDDLKTRPSIEKSWPPHWKTSPPSSFLSE